MGGKELRDQNTLIAKALEEAGVADRRRALDGTIGDTQSFCWAALRQFPDVGEKSFVLAHTPLRKI